MQSCCAASVEGRPDLETAVASTAKYYLAARKEATAVDVTQVTRQRSLNRVTFAEVHSRIVGSKPGFRLAVLTTLEVIRLHYLTHRDHPRAKCPDNRPWTPLLISRIIKMKDNILLQHGS